MYIIKFVFLQVLYWEKTTSELPVNVDLEYICTRTYVPTSLYTLSYRRCFVLYVANFWLILYIQYALCKGIQVCENIYFLSEQEYNIYMYILVYFVEETVVHISLYYSIKLCLIY